MFFKTPEAEGSYCAAYDASLQLWPTPHESLDAPTKFGVTHIVACGPADKEPLILLPAMACTATMWYATVAGLCREFRCYAVDFPSDMGLSIPTPAPATPKDCVTWFGELLDGLGIARASIVGASYGGFLAVNYAVAEPGRVRKLVITSPAAVIVAIRKTLYLRVFATLLLPGKPATDRIMRILTDRLPLDHPVIRQLGVGMKCLNARLRVYPRVFSDAELRGIPAPLYLLLGEKEVCYNPQSAAARARRVMPQARVDVIPGAGHLLAMECPEVVNPRILEFLKTG